MYTFCDIPDLILIPETLRKSPAARVRNDGIQLVRPFVIDCFYT
jgi:hypothetical protein